MASKFTHKLLPFLFSKTNHNKGTEIGTCPCADSTIIDVQPSQPSEIVASTMPRPSQTTSEQEKSLFLQRLPVELRMMVYQHVWRYKYAHKYDEPVARHISYERGRWKGRRCVMYRDDDLDSIQNQMDISYNAGKLEDLQYWHAKARSTWGCRHYRCEEQLRVSGSNKDKTNLSSLMLCKKMYPEVMQSFFESHKFIFGDIVSAHEFLTGDDVPYTKHIRDLELSLSMGQFHYRPFIPENDKSRLESCDFPSALMGGSWVKDIWASLQGMVCLHNLRISFDVYDRGPWRKIPERSITAGLVHLRVMHDFIIELPPNLPILSPKLEAQIIDQDANVPFQIVRRQALRYWNFVPDKVEKFSWEAHKDPITGSESSCVAIFKDSSYVQASQAPYNNPHLEIEVSR